MSDLEQSAIVTAPPASSCGCASTGLKKPAAWEGFVAASVLPSAESAPEPESAQGEYNPLAPEAPLNLPRIAASNISDESEPAHAPHPLELLAPAGGLDSAYAAFHYGADAIYLGLKKFSARAEAENFTLEEVDAITAFAHASLPRRRVFVTINTLILQQELPELIAALGALSDIGVDALIVQDLGVYRIVREHFPELELHASTQLAVHNRAGAEGLRRLGFKRVVLARELTLEEVADITQTSGVETEVFIHGALCYSYSGLCLFSSQTLGRSGNRGKCAYSCRDEFKVQGAPASLRDGTNVKRSPAAGFAFSMKDLALPDQLPALRAAGVSCVKIEGRKKSPLYVATTTGYYRKLLDGALPDDERTQSEADMKTVFSRPWTRLFTQSHKDKEVADRDTVGHRGSPIGVVQAVLNEGSETPVLRFETARALERHDGLQIDLPGLGKPFGFAVEKLCIAHSSTSGARRGNRPRDVFEAPAGSTVEVALPEEHPPIPTGAKIYCSSSQSVKRRYRFLRPKPGAFRARRAVEVHLKFLSNTLEAHAYAAPRHAGESSQEHSVTIPGPFTAAADAIKSHTAARGAFEKLGETGLSLGRFEFENPAGLFVPVSQLNLLRRSLAAGLEKKLQQAQARRVQGTISQVLPALKTRLTDSPPPPSAAQSSTSSSAFLWSLKADRIGFLDSFEACDWENLDEVVLDIARDPAPLLLDGLKALSARLGPERVRVALPTLTRKWEEKGIVQKIQMLRAAGFERWEASNVSALSYLSLPSAEISFSTDWPLYVVNSAAAQELLALGASRFVLSPEDGLENMRPLLGAFGAQAVVLVYQDTPLFMAESCAYANLIGGCPGKANCRFESMEMVSSHGEKVSAIDYHCRTLVLNKTPFCLAGHLKELKAAGARLLRADFIHRKYEPGAVRDAWRLLRAGRNVRGGHAANFERGML